jgi:hypothetical protein
MDDRETGIRARQKQQVVAGTAPRTPGADPNSPPSKSTDGDWVSRNAVRLRRAKSRADHANPQMGFVIHDRTEAEKEIFHMIE